MKRHTSLRTYAHMIEGAIGAVMLALYGLSNLPVPDTHVDTQQQVEQQQITNRKPNPTGGQPAEYIFTVIDSCHYEVMKHNAQHAVKLIDYDVYSTGDEIHGYDIASVDYVYQNNVDYYNSFAIRYTCDSTGIIEVNEIGLNEVN